MQASVWFRAERVHVSADRRSTPPIGEDSPEGTLDVASARTQQPDVIFSRDGGTLEVSISRRGVHRLGVVGAVALSASVVPVVVGWFAAPVALSGEADGAIKYESKADLLKEKHREDRLRARGPAVVDRKSTRLNSSHRT